MKAFSVPRHPEAFSLGAGGKKKRPRREDKDHLAFVRSLPSCISGLRPCDPCHVRYADPVYGKGLTGKGEKSDDRWCVPMLRSEHDEQHSMNERVFWARYGLDPLRIALALYGCSGNEEEAEAIIAESVRTAKTFLGRSLTPGADVR